MTSITETLGGVDGKKVKMSAAEYKAKVDTVLHDGEKLAEALAWYESLTVEWALGATEAFADAIYQGFNLTTTIAVFYALAGDEATANLHGSYLAAVCAMRGTKITKILSKGCTDALKKNLPLLRAKYSLVDRAASPTDLTLGRVAMIFAAPIVGAIKKGLMAPTVSMAGYTGYPSGMRCPQFFMLAPGPDDFAKAADNGDDYTTLLVGFFVHQYEFDVTISGTLAKHTVQSDKILKFIKLQASNPVLSSDARVKAMAEAEICKVGADGRVSLTDSVRKALIAAAVKLALAHPEDTVLHGLLALTGRVVVVDDKVTKAK